MSGYRLDAPIGEWINRSHSVQMRLNGEAMQGFVGDTLASALLGQGITMVGRSFKLHRPRGIMSCGVEEPTGLLDIGNAAMRTPNTRATDVQAREGLQANSANCWPTLNFDLAAVNSRFAAFMPAGFYYKTFMWPSWHLFEPTIRRMAGLGVAGQGADPERYDEVSANVEVLVVGAGVAGLQAALCAAKTGRKVVLLETSARVGGWLAAQCLRDASANATVAALCGALHQAGVQVRTHTTAVACYDHYLVVAVESVQDVVAITAVRERLWKFRARQVILATGAFERPMLFPDNDRPGIMLAGAVERYAALYGVACGRRVVIATACDSSYGVAHSLRAAGVEVVAIVEQRSADQLGADVVVPQGVTVWHNSFVVGVRGTSAVTGVQIVGTGGGKVTFIGADLIAHAGGFTPNVSLYSQAGGHLQWVQTSSMFVPAVSLPGLTTVGACAGVFDMSLAIEHASAVGSTDPGAPWPAPPAAGSGMVPSNMQPTQAALAALGRKPGIQFVDFQHDVGADDIALAARENYRSVEHLKRYTTTGMATDQGKTSNINALVLMGEATGRAPQAVGTTKFRPPYKPVTLNALVGGRSSERYRPLKQLPAMEFHTARGALFEEFGGWWRPAAYPQHGENLMQAAAREAAAVRSGVGLFDGSPLGKLEVYGPDAAAFLDLMYVGTLSTMAVGGARYGVMLNENGIVVDDGIVARLGVNHFLVNTTSGGAEHAALAFEEWLQCEFVNMQVFVVPQTAQWGNVTVSGPNAWQLLAHAGFSADLAPAHMQHMTLREFNWRGMPLRILRASFNGELGYEINLPASQAGTAFASLWKAGDDLGVCMYGVEALMTMRLEKGFIHIGADTDGTTLPGDVGMARAVAKKAANFVGRRSLMRPAAMDESRPQLVGLQAMDGKSVIAVGAHIADQAPPCKAQGHVTSSAFSPALQQPIALAMLEGGARTGKKLIAWNMGKPVDVRVVSLPFYDARGERLHG